MNVHLQLAASHVETKYNADALVKAWNKNVDAVTADNWWDPCSGGSSAASDEPSAALAAFAAWREAREPDSAGLWHLLTACHFPKWVRGIAYTGQLCKQLRGVAITTNQRGDATHWLTAAHEFGHNFGARHSFEDGQGKTGGIMDYGDGKLNGVYQFHTEYRKRQVCKEISRKSNVSNLWGASKTCWKRVQK
jgi:hypothetical protein